MGINLNETLTNCPVCGTPSISDNWHEVKFPPKFLLPDLHYSKCWKCGILYLNPRMSEEETRRFYAEDYRGVLDRVYPVYSVQKDKARQVARANCISEHVVEATVASHLDIGSSQGILLKKINAPISVGVEWNKDERSECLRQGQTVYADLDLVPPDMKFELITLIQVLEHVNHPVDYLLQLKDKLTQDGRLLIEIPNGALNPMPVPWHVTAFNAKSLRFLLVDMCGFQVRSMIQYSGYLVNSQKPHYLLAEVGLQS